MGLDNQCNTERGQIRNFIQFQNLDFEFLSSYFIFFCILSFVLSRRLNNGKRFKFSYAAWDFIIHSVCSGSEQFKSSY